MLPEFTDKQATATQQATQDLGGNLPKTSAGRIDFQAISFSNEQALIGEFVNRAISSDLIASAEIAKVVMKYRAIPSFFSAANKIIENIKDSTKLREFKQMIEQGSPPEAIAAACSILQNIKSIDVFENSCKLFGRNSCGSGMYFNNSPFSELDLMRKENPIALIERIANLFTECDAILDLSTKYFPETAFFSAEIILQNSKEKLHDLKLLLNATSEISKVSSEELKKYYQSGHRFICHPKYFLPKEQRREVSNEEIEVRALLSKCSDCPAMEYFDAISKTMAGFLPERRDGLISVVSHCHKEGSDEVALDLVAAAATCQASPALIDESLSELRNFKHDELLWASKLLLDVIQELPSFLPKAIECLSHENIELFERELYAFRLRDHQNKFPEKDLRQVRKDFLKIRNQDSNPPSAEELDNACSIYSKIQEKSLVLLEKTSTDLTNLAKALKVKLSENAADLNVKIEFLSVIREVIKRQFGVYPYNTQMIALIMMINRHEKNQSLKDQGSAPRGVYEQVDTGEGKSLMNAIFAAYMASTGRNVYCGSSNSYLFKRDAIKFSEFYTSLDISSASFEYKTNKQLNHPPQILYSSNQDMIFGYLSCRLAHREFFAGKSFDVAIIDEADNLLIDMTSESCRIGQAGKGRFSEDSIKALLAYGKKESKLIKENLAEAIVDFGVKHSEVRGMEPVQIGAYLKSVIQLQNLKKDEDYIIQDNMVKIVDQQTGKIKNGFQWSHGLHEYVCLENNIPLPANLVTQAQMSHPPFLRMFKNIFCISGTFGDKTDRSELWDVYRLHGFDVAPHKPNIRIDMPITYIGNEQQWVDAVAKEANAIVKTGRPCLIVVRTHRQVSLLQAKLGSLKPQLLNDRENTDSNGVKQTDEQLIRNAGKAGMLTIANRLASRGADIRPDAKAIAVGGLHVIHDLNNNARDKKQVAGRAARQGEPGSTHCIFSIEDKTFRELPASIREVIENVADHFGAQSEELQKAIEFSLKAHNLNNSLLRREKLIREEMVLEALEHYFEGIGSTASKLNNESHVFGQHKDLSDFVVASYMSEQWAIAFEEANLRLDTSLDFESFDQDQSNLDRPASPMEQSLSDTFEEIFDTTPEIAEILPDSEVSNLMSNLYRCYLFELRQTQKILSRLDKEQAELVIKNLIEKVDALSRECFDTFKIKSWADLRKLYGPSEPNYDLKLNLKLGPNLGGSDTGNDIFGGQGLKFSNA